MTRHTVIVVSVAMITMGLMHRAAGQAPSGRDQSTQDIVRVLSPSDLRAARALPPGDRGATYYYLEGLATRVTTRFPDAVATTERRLDGSLNTRVTDREQREVASSTLRRIGADHSVIDYRPEGSDGLALAVGRADARPTLDWAARQTYRLWKDLKDGEDRPLRWQDGLMRASAAAGGKGDEPLEIETEWSGGLSAEATTTAGRRPHLKSGQMINGHAVVNRLHRDGVEVGGLVWYPEEKVLSWSFPGMTEGYVDPERLEPVGGWPFTPDLAWANVQAFAFDHFYARIASTGFVARQERGWLDQFVDFWIPTVAANEVGCDNLHWLDGTIYRFCCDIHDRCFAKYGCTSRSWWRWWTSWRCDYCNMDAIFCFVSSGKTGWPPPEY